MTTNKTPESMQFVQCLFYFSHSHSKTYANNSHDFTLWFSSIASLSSSNIWEHEKIVWKNSDEKRKKIGKKNNWTQILNGFHLSSSTMRTNLKWRFTLKHVEMDATTITLLLVCFVLCALCLVSTVYIYIVWCSFCISM